jgi:hypothetical protein
LKGVIFAEPPKEEASWYYMWGGRGYHMSGAGTDTPDRPNAIQRHSAHVESLRAQGLIRTGNIKLNPHWKKDYITLLKEHNAKSN